MRDVRVTNMVSVCVKVGAIVQAGGIPERCALLKSKGHAKS